MHFCGCLSCGLASVQYAPIAASQRNARRRSHVRAEERGDGPPAPEPPLLPPPEPLRSQSTQVDVMKASLLLGHTPPPSRRAAIGVGSAAAIALVGNLGGVTSGLLGLDGGRLATRLSLDALYPVGGFKRCLDTTYGFTFQYPASWLADQRLYLRNIERAERQRTLDPLPPPRPPPPAEGAGGTVRPVPRQAQYEPVAGFGPPGGTGEENVSVIVAPIQPGFRLEAMGSPQDAAAALLARNVAPAGSGLEAALLAADARREGGRLYYEVRGPAFYRHNLFAYAARGGLLYTLNFQVPERRWAEAEAAARQTAGSFRILAGATPAAPPPARP